MVNTVGLSDVSLIRDEVRYMVTFEMRFTVMIMASLVRLVGYASARNYFCLFIRHFFACCLVVRLTIGSYFALAVS